MKWKESSKFLFFSLQIWTNLKQHLELFWGFPSKWQSRRSQNDMLLFLENIEFKTKFTLPSNTKKNFRYVLLVYSNKFCWTVLVYKFKRGHSVGILSLNRVQRTSVILRIDRSIYHFTFLIIFALCRKTIHDSKYYTNWK